jgi:hypothetical protein
MPMKAKKPTDGELLNDDEAKRRATEWLRRTLTTPHKPQKEMVGKVGRTSKRTRKATDSLEG